MKIMIQAAMLALMFGYLPPLAHAADAEAKRADGGGAFNLSFGGGTPQKLVSEMEKAAGLKLNVLIPPELTDARIPAMELRSVSVESVFNSLNLIERNSMMWIRDHDSRNIWVLARAVDNRKTQAFYVGHLLKKFKIDDITTAVQTTWQLGGKEAKAELKYHQETQLLIALGQPEQLATMANVLFQLELAVEPERIEPGATSGVKSSDSKQGKSAVRP